MNAKWIAATAGAAAMGMSQSAWAACDAFTAVSPEETREVHVSDVDGDGAVSVGDKRIGRRALHDESGNEIGGFFWTMTVNDVDEAGKVARRTTETVYHFENGAIFTTHTDRLAPEVVGDVSKVSVVDSKSSGTIIGGTGDYAGAQGAVAIDVDGNHMTFRYNVICQ
ncbi:MAG: hypothetical protein GY798_09150 [Hyphomicrobiales bacterium]|nr:hypothetical protein [Hyphomicrobiales bacterium]